MIVERKIRWLKHSSFAEKGQIFTAKFRSFMRPTIRIETKTGFFMEMPIYENMYEFVRDHYPNTKIFRELYPNGKEEKGFWVVE